MLVSCVRTFEEAPHGYTGESFVGKVAFRISFTRIYAFCLRSSSFRTLFPDYATLWPRVLLTGYYYAPATLRCLSLRLDTFPACYDTFTAYRLPRSRSRFRSLKKFLRSRSAWFGLLHRFAHVYHRIARYGCYLLAHRSHLRLPQRTHTRHSAFPAHSLFATLLALCYYGWFSSPHARSHAARSAVYHTTCYYSHTTEVTGTTCGYGFLLHLRRICRIRLRPRFTFRTASGSAHLFGSLDRLRLHLSPTRGHS